MYVNVLEAWTKLPGLAPQVEKLNSLLGYQVEHLQDARVKGEVEQLRAYANELQPQLSAAKDGDVPHLAAQADRLSADMWRCLTGLDNADETLPKRSLQLEKPDLLLEYALQNTQDDGTMKELVRQLRTRTVTPEEKLEALQRQASELENLPADVHTLEKWHLMHSRALINRNRIEIAGDVSSRETGREVLLEAAGKLVAAIEDRISDMERRI